MKQKFNLDENRCWRREMSKQLPQLAQLRACLGSQAHLPSDTTLLPVTQTLHHGVVGVSED